MKLNREGTELIHDFETCELEAYECPASKQKPTSQKFWTIGWGNTFYADGSKVKKGDVITQAEANRLFEVVVEKYFVSPVKRLIKVPLNDNQFSALVSFTYNLGVQNFKTSTLLKKVNANPQDPTIADEFKKWINKGSPFEKGLLRRRIAESELYFK